MMTAQDAKRWVEVTGSTLGIPFIPGNAIDVLRNGDEIFPPMLAAIESAQSSICFLTFVYWQGEIAERFATALAAAATRGVSVSVILDAFGAKGISTRALEIMEDAPIHLRWFRKLRPWRLQRSAHRTHRKVLVVDRSVGFTGGVGIADEWSGDARTAEEWRETHFRIRGPAVQGLWSAFVGTWFEIDERLPPTVEARPSLTPVGDATIQVVRSTASYGLSDVAMVLHGLVHQARQRIRITTPYFVPDPSFLRALKARINAGVAVEVLIPGPHIDSELVRLARTELLSELLQAGAKIWYYQPTMLHAKVITIDGLVTCIGSANLNGRSLRQDDELILTVLDPALAETLDAHFDADLARSEPMSLARTGRRPAWRKLIERVVSPFRRHL